MYCKNCGAKLEEGALFCQECGTRIEYEEAASASDILTRKDSLSPDDSLSPADPMASASLNDQESYGGSASVAASDPGPVQYRNDTDADPDVVNPSQEQVSEVKDPISQTQGNINPDWGQTGSYNAQPGQNNVNSGMGQTGSYSAQPGQNNVNPGQKEKKKTSPCLIIVIVLAVLFMIGAAISLILIFYLGTKAKTYIDKVKEEVETESGYDNDGTGYDKTWGSDNDMASIDKEMDEWDDKSADEKPSGSGDEGYGEKDERGYSDEELCEMALDFYEGVTGYRPDYATIESEESDGVVIGVYEDNPQKRTGLAFYKIDRETARGYDNVFGIEIDLLDPEAAQSEYDSYGDQDYDEGLNEYLCSWSDFAIIDEDNWFDLEQDIRNRRPQMPGDRTIAQMIINEIYARNGYIFKDNDLNSYFEVYSWYEGDTRDMKTIEGRLNDYETRNIKFLQKVNK